MTLYRKSGRKYIPVKDAIALVGVDNGTWAISVEHGKTQKCEAVDLNKGFEALAACAGVIDWLVEELGECTKLQPARQLTSKEELAMKAYIEVLGEVALTAVEKPLSFDVAMNIASRLTKYFYEAKSQEEQSKP